MHAAAATADPPSPVRVELEALARAAAGACLFGVPLLFTMEMWWLGRHIAGPKLVALLVLAFLVNVALARLGGFREGADRTLRGDVAQATESMAVGLLVAAAVLATIGVIGPDSSASSALGALAVQVVPLSLGASVANLIFAVGSGRAGDGSGDELGPPGHEFLNDLVATVSGAVVVGFAIAPTDEVPMLAVAVDAWRSLGIVAVSLLAGYLIVFASGFDRSHHQSHEGGIFQGAFSETAFTWVVSCVVALVLLVAFGRVHLDTPLHAIVTQALVLAVPASIGGAAGRIVI